MGGESWFWATKTQAIVHKAQGLYLELSHLLQLEPEFGHTAPHVEQAHVDGRGPRRQGLAGGPHGLQGTESLPARNVGHSYEKEEPRA